MIVVMLLILWCATLIIGRLLYTKSVVYLFLAWNIALAAIPLLASTLLVRSRSSRRIQIMLFIIWLLFFPNAPYLLTDLIHLIPRPHVPVWYDLSLLLSCAGTGLFFGYLSLYEVHSWLETRVRRWMGWGISIVVLFLSSFGIYLGRFLRWNSWDIFTSPKPLFSDMVISLTDPSYIPRTLSVTIVFGIMLTLGYLAVRVFVDCAKPNTAVPHGKREKV